MAQTGQEVNHGNRLFNRAGCQTHPTRKPDEPDGGDVPTTRRTADQSVEPDENAGGAAGRH